MLEYFHSRSLDKKSPHEPPLDHHERVEFAQALADAQEAAADGSRPWPGEDEAA